MGYLSKSVSHKDLLALLIIAAVSAIPSSISAPVTITIGGDVDGWNTGVNYQTWASTQVFHIGDTIAFWYTKEAHSVYQVTKSEYESCTVPSDTTTALVSGYDKVRLTTEGQLYFICGTPTHCASGQKISINVLAATT